VDFGVESGIECNAAMWIRDYRWRALMIEADEEHFAKLTQNYHGFSNLRATRRAVTRENILDILREQEVPQAFDVLSIDTVWNDLDDRDLSHI